MEPAKGCKQTWSVEKLLLFGLRGQSCYSRGAPSRSHDWLRGQGEKIGKLTAVFYCWVTFLTFLLFKVKSYSSFKDFLPYGMSFWLLVYSEAYRTTQPCHYLRSEAWQVSQPIKDLKIHSSCTSYLINISNFNLRMLAMQKFLQKADWLNGKALLFKTQFSVVLMKRLLEIPSKTCR